MSFLKLWLAGTAVLLTAVAVWAFAPVLVFLALLTGALGALSFLMIALARRLERARNKAHRGTLDPS
jgi:hypothetical protein